MLAKFDRIISEHLFNISKSRESKTRMPHYLGQNFQNEIINIFSDTICNKIKTILDN